MGDRQKRKRCLKYQNERNSYAKMILVSQAVSSVSIGGVLNHVHMYVAIPPKFSVSEFMSYLKGKSSLMIFDRHPEYRRKGADRHFWARGYFVATVGNVNEETIVEYIRNQEENDKLED